MSILPHPQLFLMTLLNRRAWGQNDTHRDLSGLLGHMSLKPPDKLRGAPSSFRSSASIILFSSTSSPAPSAFFASTFCSLEFSGSEASSSDRLLFSFAVGNESSSWRFRLVDLAADTLRRVRRRVVGDVGSTAIVVFSQERQYWKMILLRNIGGTGSHD